MGSLPTMTKPNSTEIIVILDRSGSMEPIAADMCGGFDQFIADQRKEPGTCTVSLAQFAGEYETVYSAVDIHSVPPLALIPRGNTALLDAIGRTINETGERLSSMAEDARPSKVIVLIITDGEENASREFTQAQINGMITHQREAYSWDFVYLGANQDAIAVAKGLGVPPAAAINYAASPTGARAVYAVACRAVSTSRGGGGATVIAQSDYDEAVARAHATVTPRP